MHGMAIVALLMMIASCGKKVEVSLSPSTIAFTSEGGEKEVALTSNGDWQLEFDCDWVSVEPASGKGDATLVVTVTPNSGEQARELQVKVITKDHEALLTVTQDIREMPFLSLNPNQINCDRLGGTFDVAVASNIEWKIPQLPEGITASVEAGSGNATVSITISALENDQSGREVSVVFSGGNLLVPLTINQSASSTYDVLVDPTKLDFGYEGGTATVSVSCGSNWTAVADAEWISLSAASGDGNTTIEVIVAESDMLVPRSGSVTFNSAVGSSASILVNQEAAPDPHFLTVNPTDFFFGKEGGTQTFSIGCDVEWSIETEDDWATPSAFSGTGDATLTLTVEPNYIAEPRELSLVVVSGSLAHRLIVQQEAGEVALVVTLSPDTLSVPDVGSTGAQVHVVSNTSWYMVASDWISNLPIGLVEGDATVNLIVDQNSSPEPRYGFVRAMRNGQLMDEIIVVQEGKPDLLEIDVTEFDVRPEGAQISFHVTSNQAWNVTWDVNWVQCQPVSGFGNGDVTVNVDPMISSRPRTATIYVKAASGRMVTVTVKQQP